MNQFVVKNELTKYGYVPWVNKRPVQVEEPDSAAPAGDREELVRNGICAPEASPPSPLPAQPAASMNGATVSTATSDLSLQHLPTPIPKQRSTTTPKSVGFKEDEDQKLKDPRSRRKLDANLCPTPRSFAPVAARRFTILPPGLTQSIAASDKTEAVVFKKKEVVQDVSRNNPFASDATTRFNLPILMQSYNLQPDGTPPPNASESTLNEQETIEFTPGLTTRRPVAVKRCKEPTRVMPNRKVNDVANSFKNLSFVGTPTQPVPSRNLLASVKAVKSHGKMKQVGDRLVPATPQMPVSNIDQDLFKYYLRSKK